MLKIINSGCNGYMGRAVTAAAKRDPEAMIVAGIDLDISQGTDFPIFVTASDLCESGTIEAKAANVVVDFSAPAALEGLLDYGQAQNIPLVLCTTGYSDEQNDAIQKASKCIPIFHSGNMSLGINLLAELIRRACEVLGEDFDVEIVERHHRRKVDAPSGTALMLAEAASEALPYMPAYIFDRESMRRPRKDHEIGISAVRGGTIVGEHEIIFAGQDEVIEFKHTAMSRDIFAAGAIKAAKFITGKQAGMYSMKDVLG